MRLKNEQCRETFTKHWELLEHVLNIPLSVNHVLKIEEGWNAFYTDPLKYKDSIVVDMILKDLDLLIEIEFEDTEDYE